MVITYTFVVIAFVAAISFRYGRRYQAQRDAAWLRMLAGANEAERNSVIGRSARIAGEMLDERVARGELP